MQTASTRRVASMQQVRATHATPKFTYLCKECHAPATAYHADLRATRQSGEHGTIDVHGQGIGTWRCHECRKVVKVTRVAA